MDQQQAKQFVQKIIHVWEQGHADELAQFYDPKVVGHYQDKLLDLADIKNRMAYIN